jgi:hypothetical protein
LARDKSLTERNGSGLMNIPKLNLNIIFVHCSTNTLGAGAENAATFIRELGRGATRTNSTEETRAMPFPLAETVELSMRQDNAACVTMTKAVV